MSMIDKSLLDKANALKPKLRHRRAYPESFAEITADSAGFQGLTARKTADVRFPITLNCGDSIVLDFGCHNVGYLHFAVNHTAVKINDSPLQFKFTFGEFPLEIVANPEEYKGTLGIGWLQHETKSVVFTPYSGSLERRYSFRYLKIERTGNMDFPVEITDLWADCVSAVDVADLPRFPIADLTLKRIYDMSVRTLAECEQDVFEDGPKRDRRLWIGDLRLQALTDYCTFKNYDLIKRCLYLFAACRNTEGLVSACVFPDSPPHVDEWTMRDYSLFFVSCLLDYVQNTGDTHLGRELFPVARHQIDLISHAFENNFAEYHYTHFIDWCPDLDRSVAAVGQYIYVLKQYKELCNILGTDPQNTDEKIRRSEEILMGHYSPADGLFITEEGQKSWHSQVWAVLSGVIEDDKAIDLLHRTESQSLPVIMHTPYMTHCYIEALFKCGLKDRAMEVIKDYWGKIAQYGFDCCPEVFNPADHFESPYGAAEINSACHAWSCTPAYWIHKYYTEK